MKQQFKQSLQARVRLLRQQQQGKVAESSSRVSLSEQPALSGNYEVDLELDAEGRLRVKEDQVCASDFTKVRTLGLGSYGRVILVRFKGNKEHYFAMKRMEKETIASKDQMEHVRSEEEILCELNFPFTLSLKANFEDSKYIYFITEYAPGGDLFMRLRREGRFSNDVALFYMTEIALALNYLHERQLIYRDLKPENILISRLGHVLLADFGFAKHVPSDRTMTICGTPEYLAPEVIESYYSRERSSYGKSVDWWALGVLLYEMLAGYPPFIGKSPDQIYEKVNEGIVEFPKAIPKRARDLIKRLLNPDPRLRLGSSDAGESIMRHEWFRGVNWQAVLRKEIPAPWVPLLKHEEDTSNFQSFKEDDSGW